MLFRSPSHIPHACAEPAGAATAYEQVKRNEYASVVDSSSSDLVPVIYDTFGGLGKGGRQFIDFIVEAASKRSGLGAREGRLRQLAIINRCITRQVARLLLLAA